MNYLDYIKKTYTNYLIKDSIEKTRISPNFIENEILAVSSLNNITNEHSLNKFNNKSGFSSGSFIDRNHSILNWINTINKTISNISTDYITSIDNYILLCNRINNENMSNENKISEIMNYSCIYIDPTIDANQKMTNTVRIGNYIILPFCFGNTTVYNKKASFSIYSTDNISYSNTSLINTLPLVRPLSIKFKPENNTSTVSVSLSLAKVNTNLIYINTTGSVGSIQMNCFYNNAVVFSDTVYDSEALFNFGRSDIDKVTFNINTNQYNLSQQASVQINDITIFSNVYFLDTGIFQSKNREILNYNKVNSFGVNAINYNQTPSVNFNKYLSISFDETSTSFIQIDESSMKLPLGKLNNTVDLTTGILESDNLYITTPSDADVTKRLEKEFNNLSTSDQSSTLFNFVPKTAVILAGVSQSYINSLEHWSKVNNSYITSLINFEKNVSLDIGDIEISLNGKTVSGIINIPLGISTFQIHESNIDFTYGTNSQSSLENGNIINSDKLFPLNFAYKIGGLPEYSNGVIVQSQTLSFSIQNTTEIQLQDSFLPLTMNVSSTITNAQYSLTFTETPMYHGTFTVSPYSGSIKVNPFGENDDIAISYTLANPAIRPCGILFNRQINYIPYAYVFTALSSLGEKDDTYFTMMSNGTSRDILIPTPDTSSRLSTFLSVNTAIKNYSLLCDTDINTAYIANKFILQSKDNSLTPVIKNIFFQGNK